ncbi:BREX-1 system adenine-specific DNA-methyltransferase PglX [Empedobacter falsenii]
MNTSQLKSFAQQARLKLMEQVGAKLHYVLNVDSASIRGKEQELNKLKAELNEIGEQALIEKVAYTWFNRLVAIRFMDTNGFQPFNVSIISPVEGSQSSLAEVIELIQGGNIPEELNLDRGLINDLLDGKAVSNNPNNEIMRMVLVEACNYYHSLFPFLFEKINDYTELLLPDDLVSPISILADVVKGMSKEDCAEVEIIGWLYQFYISEKKDQVFAGTGRVKKEDIPAATQLFTPRWIVEYMVQNTVGKLWLLNNPNSSLKEIMPYYIETENTDDYLHINSVEEIKLLDQACGSGHILVYGFELLAKIYEEEGYTSSEIPAKIIENNLHGFEIDERASQLASFAIVMKARQYYRRFFRKPVAPKILTYQDVKFTEEELHTVLADLGLTKQESLKYDVKLIEQATNFGSLIQPHTELGILISVQEKLNNLVQTADLFTQDLYARFATVLEQLIPLAYKYHCVVQNPPYMGGGKYNDTLAKYINTNYPDAKADLFSAFIERSINVCIPKGLIGNVTMESWMFLSSFEKFRKNLLENTTIDSLSHFGWHIMRIAFGTVAFILKNYKHDGKTKGVYNYLEIDDIDKNIERPYNFPNLERRYSITNQKDFKIIPGNNIGYWLSAGILNSFIDKRKYNEFTTATGLICGTTEKFIKYSHEVDINLIEFNNIECETFGYHNKSWAPINHGGSRVRWYGNHNKIVYFKNNAEKIRAEKNSMFRNEKFYFKEGITWNRLNTNSFASRLASKGFVFEDGSPTLFVEDTYKMYFLALMNSKPYNEIINIFKGSLKYEKGNVDITPVLLENNIVINNLSTFCVNISKEYWDSNEISWDFTKNELVRLESFKISSAIENFKVYWKDQFYQLHQNEEELNRQFIEIYGLQDELTPDVALEDITILKDETEIVNGELVFKEKEIIAQFISYAVGCVFGRFSYDKEGLILANQGETFQDYLTKVGKTKEQLQFVPDEDNIVPLLEEEWFYDDMVTRVKDFVKAVWGEASYSENIAYIENTLGKDLRKYLVKDFYKDHIKRYKKRPIYWQFSSPKGAFNVLIYMHRYTKDTLSEILNGYLREFIGKLENHIKHLETVVVTGSAAEQAKARKEIDKLKNQIDECRAYEVELYKLAADRIEIDLDEGVLVNYNKFGNVIAPVAGLNDKKTKDKVKKFDWIDTTQIR